MLTEILKEVKPLKPEILALKTKMDAFSKLLIDGFAAQATNDTAIQTSLTNISGDIAKLQASNSLSDEDKAILQSISDGLDGLTTQVQTRTDQTKTLADNAAQIANIVPDDAPANPPANPANPPVDPLAP